MGNRERDIDSEIVGENGENGGRRPVCRKRKKEAVGIVRAVIERWRYSEKARDISSYLKNLGAR